MTQNQNLTLESIIRSTPNKLSEEQVQHLLAGMRALEAVGVVPPATPAEAAEAVATLAPTGTPAAKSVREVQLGKEAITAFFAKPASVLSLLGTDGIAYVPPTPRFPRGQVVAGSKALIETAMRDVRLGRADHLSLELKFALLDSAVQEEAAAALAAGTAVHVQAPVEGGWKWYHTAGVAIVALAIGGGAVYAYNKYA